MKLTVTTSTSNDAVSTLFNSTAGTTQAVTSGSIGTFRSRYSGQRVTGSVTTGNQGVTLRLRGLENGSWVTISSTSIASSTTQPFDFLSRHPDYLVDILNGSTGPSTLVAEADLVPKGDRSAGA
jgi:hypothetical protein